ncbi:thiamine ABC transporter ATP-binding protein [soil metagenome]
MITLNNAVFRYEDWIAAFDFRVERGEFLAVIGPSGSGKSTLLSLIAGFEAPTTGRILLDDRDMTGVPPAKRPVTMVFQDHNTFAHLDIRTNVALGVSPALRLSADDNARIDAALARTGLAALSGRKPGEISGGERQRVAIARALVRDRPILLLDEPFAALGPGLRHDMLDLLSALQAEKGFTVVLVSHHPDDARRAAAKTAFLADGHILALEPTEQLFARRDLPALNDYLGTAG